MEWSFDLNIELPGKQKRRLISSSILAKEELFDQSIVLLWSFLRDSIFSILSLREISFKSTEEAIYKIIEYVPDKETKSNLYSIYVVSILLDWDEDFIIDKNQFLIIKNKFENIFNYLSYDGQ